MRDTIHDLSYMTSLGSGKLNGNINGGILYATLSTHHMIPTKNATLVTSDSTTQPFLKISPLKLSFERTKPFFYFLLFFSLYLISHEVFSYVFHNVSEGSMSVLSLV